MSELETSHARSYVARLYYEQGLTKLDIAARLGISRFRVARLLDAARRDGTVRIEIREPVEVDVALGRLLEERFGLALALVAAGAADDAPLPALAAGWLPELLRPDDVVGIAGGTTLQRLVHGIGDEPQLPAIPVVQICGAAPAAPAGSGASEIAWDLARRLGGAFHPLPAPALLASPAARDAVLAREPVATTAALFGSVTVALVGIGAPGDGQPSALLDPAVLDERTLAALRDQGAVGDLLVHPFADDGSFVDAGLDERAVAIGLDDLGRSRVVAVAGGIGKERAVAAALRTGLLDVLVTDERCARAALERGGAPPPGPGRPAAAWMDRHGPGAPP